jgi:DNA-directed RNA polymerase specialized sigma24 family protein
MPERRHTHAVFLTTRWTVVARARGDSPSAREALEQLCAACWFPLYAFARRSGRPPADAQDLFSRVDAGKGRLRTFLLTAFKRHMAHEDRKEATLKRGGHLQSISFDEAGAESWYADQLVNGETAEKMYDRQWALTLLESVINELATDWDQRGKAELFEALRPFLTVLLEEGDYAGIEAVTGLSRSAIKSAVHRLRAQYRERLIRRVKETQLDGADHEDELRVLLEALS